jgi:hypothetical protein
VRRRGQCKRVVWLGGLHHFPEHRPARPDCRHRRLLHLVHPVTVGCAVRSDSENYSCRVLASVFPSHGPCFQLACSGLCSPRCWGMIHCVQFSDLKEALMNKRRQQKAASTRLAADGDLSTDGTRSSAKFGGVTDNPSFGVTAKYEINPLGAAVTGPPPPPRLARPAQTTGDHSGQELSPYHVPGMMVVDTKVQPPPSGPFLQEEYTITSR